MAGTIELLDYWIRVTPGLIAGMLFSAIIPRKILAIRIFTYIFFFIIIRDAMTPAGFWSFGTEGVFWIRWVDNPLTLTLFGLGSPFLVWLMNRVDPDLKDLLIWFKGSKASGLVVGILGAVLVVFPLYVVYQFVPIDQRGGVVAVSLLPPILIITLGGNLYEEVIFRGYLQGFLERTGYMSPLKAAFASGIAFAFGHTFLAIIVTNVGIGLLLFALYEGLTASMVRMKFGVLPATLTHGMAIFLLSSGLLQ